jgi:hypothetical protein
MSHPTSRVTPGPYLILEVSIEKAVSGFMVFASLFLASEYFLINSQDSLLNHSCRCTVQGAKMSYSLTDNWQSHVYTPGFLRPIYPNLTSQQKRAYQAQQLANP